MLECPNCHIQIPLHEDTRTLWRIGSWDLMYALAVTPKDEFIILQESKGTGVKKILTYKDNISQWFGIKNGKIIRINMHTLPTIIKEYERL